MFAFNERAIRSYRKVGFILEGRAREAIWRDGRHWDELQMSILEGDWAAIRGKRGRRGSASVTADAPVGAGAAADPARSR